MTDQHEQTRIEDIFIVDQNGDATGIEAGDTFQIDTREKTEWFLKKLQSAEAEAAGAIAAVKAAETVIGDHVAAAMLKMEEDPAVIAARAQIENARRIERAASSRAFALRGAFSKPASDVALKLLPKGSKTFATAWGSIAFKTKPARAEPVDAAKAGPFLIGLCPAAVRYDILISEVTKEVKAELIADPKQAEQFGFTIHEEEEVCTIDTGIVGSTAKAKASK